MAIREASTRLRTFAMPPAPHPHPPPPRASAWSYVGPAAAAIALGYGAVRLTWAIAEALALVVLAIALASALAPLVDRLHRHMPRSIAVVTVYACGCAAFIAGAWLLAPGFEQEMSDFAQRAPDLMAKLQDRMRTVLPHVDGANTGIVTQVTSWLQTVSTQLGSLLFGILVIVFLSMYFLTVAPTVRWFLISLFPRAHRRRAGLVLCQMARQMGGYFRGVAINAAIIGGITFVALEFIGLDYALPLATLAAFGEFVPYLGPIVAAVPAIAVALLQSTREALIVIVTYIVIQQAEGHILTPLIMRSQTSIHPATVIVALTAGFTIGGILGALAAIPTFAAGRVVVRRVLAPALRRAARG